jgi:methylated-DNA-[protein]-cysteine S-methyltransferase
MTMKTNFDSSSHFESPLGTISLFALDNAIVALNIGGDAAIDSGKSKVLIEAQKQLERFFAGKTKTLDFAVLAAGTDFQKSVWNEIAKIGFGQTTTYAEIAKKIGKPLASRAVGGAVGANPVPLVIGCHRVLGASGKITGYSGGDGLPTKRWLLKLEGISAKE